MSSTPIWLEPRISFYNRMNSTGNRRHEHSNLVFAVTDQGWLWAVGMQHISGGFILEKYSKRTQDLPGKGPFHWKSYAETNQFGRSSSWSLPLWQIQTFLSKNLTFWNVTSHSLIEVYCRLRWTHCLHLQSKIRWTSTRLNSVISQEKNSTVHEDFYVLRYNAV
jgi:hypothetical protein